LGHDERALARGAGRYGVDRADADRRRGCGGGGDSGTNGALGCCGIEAWPGRGDQHQQSGLLLADLPPGSVEQVQDLVEDHRLDRDGPAAGCRQEQDIVRTSVDRLDQAKRQPAQAPSGGERDPVGQLVADQRERATGQDGHQQPGSFARKAIRRR
jgi:hypothetical protein